MNEAAPINRRDQRREAILKIAEAVFHEEGFAAASMSTIAARLGGSKGTLYNYFKSKDELFATYIQDSCARVAEETFGHGLDDSEPVQVVLQRVGERLMNHIYSDESVANFRLLVAEAKRTPELAETFYRAGPAVGRERLAEYFERAVKRGALGIDDYARAAEQFIGLCRGDLHFRVMLNLIETPTDDQVRDDVEAAVKVFLAAYGPKG